MKYIIALTGELQTIGNSLNISHQQISCLKLETFRLSLKLCSHLICELLFLRSGTCVPARPVASTSPTIIMILCAEVCGSSSPWKTPEDEGWCWWCRQVEVNHGEFGGGLRGQPTTMLRDETMGL